MTDTEKLLLTVQNLTARIEAIEQRQAKLACSECSAVASNDEGNGTERDQWVKLAKMLPEYVRVDDDDDMEVGYRDCSHEGYYERTDNPIGQALLMGLACAECNGSVQQSGIGLFEWATQDAATGYAEDYGDGYTSRPEAAIAMLKAYREGRNGKG